MVVVFQPESHVASCKTLDGAQQLVRFFTKRFTDNPKYSEEIRFRSIIETDGRVSVHSDIPVNQTGHLLFKQAIAEFKAQVASVSA